MESYFLAFFAGAVELLELVDKSNGTSSEPLHSARIQEVIR